MQPYRLPHDQPNQRQKTIMVANQLFSDIMLKFSFPTILHSHNGTEFKSKFIENLALQRGIRKSFISHYHLQANRKLESSNRFIKDCVQKFSVDGVLEWDQLLPYATATFKWFPNEHSQESSHFLYFGCDPYLSHLAAFYNPN